MSEKKEYMTNRIVTEGYLQACERACGPLQGGASGSAVAFPTIEELNIDSFELLPSGLRYPEYTNMYTTFITKDGNHKYYGDNYSSTLIHFDIQNNTSEELKVRTSGYLKCINNQTANQYIYETKDGNNIFIGNTNYSGTILIKNHNTVEILYSNETMSNFVEDNEGNVYFHGATSGVVKYNIESGTKTQISTDNLLTKCDSKGNIYTYNSTTSKAGIIENNTITELTTSDTISDFNIAESKDGYIYGISYGGDLYYINVESKTISLLHSMSGNVDLSYFTIGDDNCIYFSGGGYNTTVDLVCLKEGQAITMSLNGFSQLDAHFYKAQDGSMYLYSNGENSRYFSYVKDGIITILTSDMSYQNWILFGESADGTVYAQASGYIIEVKSGKIINTYGPEVYPNFTAYDVTLAIIKDKDIYFYLPELSSGLNIYQNNDYFNNRKDSLNCLYPAPFVNPYTDTLKVLHTDTLEIVNVNLFRQKEE